MWPIKAMALSLWRIPVIDIVSVGRTVIATIPVGDQIISATVDSDNHTIDVTYIGGASAISHGPHYVASDPSTPTARVANVGDNTISAISPGRPGEAPDQPENLPICERGRAIGTYFRLRRAFSALHCGP
jgi:DNA-binding beta-propeller fold protein YncE